MIHALLALPYVHYWLPLLVALGLSVPIYLVAARPRRQLVEAAPPPVEAEDSDPFEDGSTGEQRVAFRRQGNPVEVHYSDSEDAPPHRGLVVDRSIGGLRLMARHDFAPGTVLALRPVKVSPMVPWVQVEVRSARPSDIQPGEFDLGCRFVKSPPYPILLLFG